MISGTRLRCGPLAALLLASAALMSCSRSSSPTAETAASTGPLLDRSSETPAGLPRQDAVAARESDSHSPRPTPTLKRAAACSYLSAVEISGVVGGPIGKPDPKESDSTTHCGYPPLDMTSYQQADIDIEWDHGDAPSFERQLSHAFGGSAEGRKVAHEVKLGDASSYSSEGVLRIQSGRTLITITLLMRPDSEAKAIAIGTLLLKRMGAEPTEPSPPDVAAQETPSLNVGSQPDGGYHVAGLPEGVKLGERCADSDASVKAANASAATAEQSALVPLKVGLTLADVWTGGEGAGDHECLMQVTAVTDEYVDVTNNCAQDHENVVRPRRLCRADMRLGEFYHPAFVRGGARVISPATAFSLSNRSLQQLRAKGKTRLYWFEMDNDPKGVARPLIVDADSTLYAVKAGQATYQIIINDKTVDLPVVTVDSQKPRDKSADEDGEDESPFSPDRLDKLQAFALGLPTPEQDRIGATILDDERFPLVLDYQVPGRKYRLRYTKISYAAPAEMEKQLATEKHVDVYGIYFDFANDRLRPESAPVLEEIAGILQKNSDWKLSITGHTDNIGGDASNLELSRKRAAAVKTALVERYHIAAARLASGGMGASQPQAKNDTPEGRARNRRVELTRQ